MHKIYLMAIALSFSPKGFCQTVVASWYDQPGLTASGSKYDPRKFTAAHRTLPFGTKVRLRKGDRSVTVEITDRGPFIKGRHLDLSKAAAKRLDVKGVEKIEIVNIKRSQENERIPTKRRTGQNTSGIAEASGSRSPNFFKTGGRFKTGRERGRHSK